MPPALTPLALMRLVSALQGWLASARAASRPFRLKRYASRMSARISSRSMLPSASCRQRWGADELWEDDVLDAHDCDTVFPQPPDLVLRDRHRCAHHEGATVYISSIRRCGQRSRQCYWDCRGGQRNRSIDVNEAATVLHGGQQLVAYSPVAWQWSVDGVHVRHAIEASNRAKSELMQWPSGQRLMTLGDRAPVRLVPPTADVGRDVYVPLPSNFAHLHMVCKVYVRGSFQVYSMLGPAVLVNRRGVVAINLCPLILSTHVSSPELRSPGRRYLKLMARYTLSYEVCVLYGDEPFIPLPSAYVSGGGDEVYFPSSWRMTGGQMNAQTRMARKRGRVSRA